MGRVDIRLKNPWSRKLKPTSSVHVYFVNLVEKIKDSDVNYGIFEGSNDHLLYMNNVLSQEMKS